jgi:hypothetical protein
MDELIKYQSKSQFVKPHYIDALGCEGLTAAEIAQSLGVKTTHIRQKLKKGGRDKLLKLLERDVSQERAEISALSEVTTALLTDSHEISNLPFEEFYLTTLAAKLFVALYQNEIGRAYLAFLICLDVAVEKYLEVEKQRTLLERKVLLLTEEVAKMKEDIAMLKTLYLEATKITEEYINDEEFALLNKVLQQRLKAAGCTQPKYKRQVVSHIYDKFFTHIDEDRVLERGITRRNWLAAKEYIQKLPPEYFRKIMGR